MQPYDLPKSEWPEYLHQYKELKGIFIGSCKYNDEYPKKKQRRYSKLLGSFTENTFWTLEDFLAEAHPYSGVICLPQLNFVHSKKLMIHEIAHLILPLRSGHNKAWGEQVLAMGGSLGMFHCGNLRFSPAHRHYGIPKDPQHKNYYMSSPWWF